MADPEHSPLDLLATPWRRRFLFAALYFAEGAPIGFIWWYLPTQLRLAGVPIDQITRLTALLVLPWTLKFVWAPALDGLRRRGFSYRRWAFLAQSAMALALVPLLLLDPATQFPWIVACLLAHSFAAATQDVAIDGLAITTTPEGQRGGLNGWMQAGMLIGRSMFGGVALMVAANFDPRAVPAGLLIAIVGTLALLFFARERAPASGAGEAGLLATIRAALGRRTTWLGLGFALISGAGFEAVGAVAGPFLVDRGQGGAAIGGFLAFPAVIATVVGGFLGGAIADRLGGARAVTGALLGLAVVIFVLAGATGASPGETYALLTAVYFGIGTFTASSYALFMDLTDSRLGATQFSSYMAATNACEAWAGLLVGRLVVQSGYGFAFGVLAAISLVGVPIALLISRAQRRELRLAGEISDRGLPGPTVAPRPG
ncbi:MAG: MFS transporter [Candidatus Eisenbacteria bacterium]